MSREFMVTVGFDPENDIYVVDESEIPGLTGWAHNYSGLVYKIAATSVELLTLNRRFITPAVSPDENLYYAVIHVLDAREHNITHKFVAGIGLTQLSAG